MSASPAGTPLWSLSVEEIARRVAAGETTAVEVLESALSRTAEVEPSIGAYLEIWADEARGRAGRIDARVAAGEPVGPLAGVPIALKDNLSFSGHAVTCASKILEGYVAPYTATAVERLLAAGAVPVGRANMDEFAMGSSCENSSVQVTRNPWDLSRVPGGSSGGPAAAVAAGSVPLSFGSDTGGSIRQPAALSGIVGFKPTYGRVSRYGLVAFASSTDQIGPLAKNVRDAGVGYAAIAGPDAHDSTCADRAVEEPLAGIEDGIRGLKIGSFREVDASGLGPANARCWQESLERLARAGAEIVEVSVPSLQAAIAVYYVIATSEASANLARFDGIRYGRRASGANSLSATYVQSRSEGFGPEVKRRIMLGTFALSSGYYDAYYGRARAVLETMRRELDAAFERCDLLVSPTSPTGAFRIGERSADPLAMYLSDIYTTPASLVGLPALALPAGFDDEGLPLSLQITGRPFAEAQVLRAGRAFEATGDWRVAPTFKNRPGLGVGAIPP
ncbi:MAG: Asp-tRNA(Asn)/Glu-tRNA(Gln) amidotransferase subunit GatA [Acidobacteriota bacterium]